MFLLTDNFHSTSTRLYVNIATCVGKIMSLTWKMAWMRKQNACEETWVTHAYVDTQMDFELSAKYNDPGMPLGTPISCLTLLCLVDGVTYPVWPTAFKYEHSPPSLTLCDWYKPQLCARRSRSKNYQIPVKWFPSYFCICLSAFAVPQPPCSGRDTSGWLLTTTSATVKSTSMRVSIFWGKSEQSSFMFVALWKPILVWRT